MASCCGANEAAQTDSKEKKIVNQEMILEALRPVVDPEIGMSVVDLGMIREIVIDKEGKVEIKMVLTTPFCPLASMLTEQVQQATAAVPGVKEAKVTLLDEPWDPSWMKR
jgi:serine O-acetyltransferase